VENPGHSTSDVPLRCKAIVLFVVKMQPSRRLSMRHCPSHPELNVRDSILVGSASGSLDL